jgi:hypothetical protein
MQPRRKKISVKAPQSFTFTVAELPAMTDAILLLDVGKHEANIQCRLPEFELAPPLTCYVPAATLSVYFSEVPLPKVTDYEFMVDVLKKSGRPEERRETYVPMSSSASPGIFFGISNATNVFSIAIYSTLALRNVSMQILVHHPIDGYDDIRQPWRMCRLPYLSGVSTDAFSDWLAANRTRLILGLTELTQPGNGQNLLHVLAAHLGDLRLCRTILKHCARFVKVNQRDAMGRTPLLALLHHKEHVCDPHSVYYRRCVELVTLLVEDGGAATDTEDDAGNTATHFAALGHRTGSEILRLLLRLGAPPNLKNMAGLTPTDEVRQNGASFGQDPADAQEACELLAAQIDVSRQKMQEQVNAGTAAEVAGDTRRACDGARIVPEDTVPPRVYPAPSASTKVATAVVPIDAQGLPLPGPAAQPAALEILRREFEELDENGEGFISVGKMRRAYLALEGYGVSESVAEIDKAASAMGIRRDGKVTFDEYVLLMLRINAR